ncbi:hypothetical protein D9X30_5373 [Cupriavidus sp. U2]|jgi:hypothetical protein|uniref:hypothetical protein n=1 Tax=Cupriavidus sp. U2 TaxID=2920269 RepID=UPI00129E4382|nr:hypothetical protein [Cupriavidus sp. U2]KAI3589790.1 hypothetical protein D9X30_5373 [Cupriavidus sp. U2]
MSLELTPANAETGAETDAAALKTWTGRYAVSAGLFEVRPRYLPRDARPILDDDLDCIIGYHRRFGLRSHLYDLNGDMFSVAEDLSNLPPPEKRDPLMVVGGLWRANVRGVTAVGLTGTGATLATATLAQLRTRFARLAQSSLLYRGAALARMDDPQRFVPVHILRLAMRHGESVTPPPGLTRASRYLASMLIRRQPFMLDVVTANGNTTIVDFEYWRYADALPAA